MEQDEYIQASTPDHMKLAELLIQAKGTDRTMAEFSKLTGISTSTLSRIANGKISKPLSYETLKKIYDHKDAEAVFAFRALLEANGMEDKTSYEKRRAKAQHMLSREEVLALEHHAKNAIVNALLDRGVNVQTIPHSFEKRKNEAPFGLNAPYDFNLFIEDMPEQLWYFEVMDKPDGIPVGTGRTFKKVSGIFLLDAWQPEFFENQKTTFVFFHRETYQQFVCQYQGAPIHSAISAVLVDPSTERFIEESWLSQKAAKGSALSRPVSEEAGYVSVWLDGEDDDEYGEDEI